MNRTVECGSTPRLYVRTFSGCYIGKNFKIFLILMHIYSSLSIIDTQNTNRKTGSVIFSDEDNPNIKTNFFMAYRFFEKSIHFCPLLL